ncbi:hypothetical protein PPYR_06569 [Photinus pyralis]|uniref:Receptor expression-enhancing protein n=2 Tax=Photinus pyralis TaxID=7054 RepID=A0A1Y1L9H8_PHOPY|nr:receptor expression-enhancing protein 4 isoform X1 [Photinus pyralis]KAB0800830.1 hypothetical protein PPYR_06569 [Photinus pyralis]
MKMISSIISRLVILICGTLYPAYASYKAVRTKNVKEYVKWMMYWIVFALFTCAETFTDVFLSWFPFYYEIKIILVIWLLSPATKGSSILYRKFVHPMLSKREHEIDEYIAKAKEQSYKQMLDLGSKGVNVLMQTAIKGGGGIVNQLRKSYSLSDLSNSHDQAESDETDSVAESVVLRKKRVPYAASTTSAIYFSEVDVRHDVMAHIPSPEDAGFGYSSGDSLYSGQLSKAQSKESLVRSGSIGSTRPRSVRITRSTTVPKNTAQAVDSNRSRKNDFDNVQREESDSSSEFLDANDDNALNRQVEVSKEICRSNFSLNDSVTKTVDKRAGKYNKKSAPLPPQSIGKEGCDSIPTIKATLVLTPGALKSDKPSNRKQSTKSDQSSPLTRLMLFQKKVQHFWHKDFGSERNLQPMSNAKRSSWYAELPKTTQLLLVNSKPISKSAENFQAKPSPQYRPLCSGNEHDTDSH